MPLSAANGGMNPRSVCDYLKSIEENPQDATPGPAINRLPAERGGKKEHFSDMGKGKD